MLSGNSQSGQNSAVGEKNVTLPAGRDQDKAVYGPGCRCQSDGAYAQGPQSGRHQCGLLSAALARPCSSYSCLCRPTTIQVLAQRPGAGTACLCLRECCTSQKPHGVDPALTMAPKQDSEALYFARKLVDDHAMFRRSQSQAADSLERAAAQIQKVSS